MGVMVSIRKKLVKIIDISIIMTKQEKKTNVKGLTSDNRQKKASMAVTRGCCEHSKNLHDDLTRGKDKR